MKILKETSVILGDLCGIYTNHLDAKLSTFLPKRPFYLKSCDLGQVT